MKPMAPLKITQKRLLSVKQFASTYGISKSTVYELIKSEADFPCRNFGFKKKFMIDVDEYEDWVEKRHTKQRQEQLQIPRLDSLMERYRK